MRTRVAILFCTLYSVLCTPAFSQDFARLSERTILGTARYVGMSGAMTAIGGDPSAAVDNPAGLGLYRRSEVLFTLDYSIDKTGITTRRLIPTQASAVFSLRTGNEDKGLIAHNLMFSYRRHRSYAREMHVSETTGPSLGHLLNEYNVNVGTNYPIHTLHDISSLRLIERGANNEFAFDWAMNYSNQWYAGLGLRLHSFSLTEDALYSEDFYIDSSYIDNSTYVSHNGVGVSAAAGLIYRPISWVRIGFGIQTPTIGALTTYSSAKTDIGTADSVYVKWSPEISEKDDRFHLPLRLSTSVACQIGAYGMLAFQYDYNHIKGQDDRHTFRVGLEVIPVLGLYLNAGYAYENTFVKGSTPAGIDPEFKRRDTYSQYPRSAHYASCAIGYRGAHMLVQMAYQYRWQKLNLYALESAAPYDIKTETHRIVLTIGWHQN